MRNYLFILFTSSILLACSAHNERYYRQNPQALQRAMQNCPDKQTTPLTCQQLAEIAMEVNSMAYQLQTSPQGFGRKILSLQQELATQSSLLQSNPHQPALVKLIENNKLQLIERLAIVKLLESPES